MLNAPINQLKLAPGSTVTLPHCSWIEFENLLQEWQNRRFPRVLFVDGSWEHLRFAISINTYWLFRGLQ